MSRRSTPILLVLGLVAPSILGIASVAAGEVEVEVADQAQIGELVEIEVSVHDDAGEPLPLVWVQVSAASTIIGEEGVVLLSSALTDDSGMATLEYLERAAADTTQELEITAHLADGPVAVEVEIVVLPGPQVHEADAPVDLPIFNVWWLIVVLGLVWLVLVYAEWCMFRLGRASTTAKPLAKLSPFILIGFVVFTAAGMAVVIINRPQSHANYVPGEPFDRAPGAVVGEEFEYTGLGFDQIDVPVSELDGESLYELTNCSGCHGVGGEGAVVGGALEGEILADLEAFIGEVRRGPKSMPTYDESQIDDEAVTKMVDYLKAEQ